MKELPLVDIAIIGAYLLGMVGIGVYFSRKNKDADQFTKASGHIPGWALGLSFYATFLSSNTFLGVPGKAFGSNWNSFVFSLSMPLAAWVAARYFVPFYRKTGEISAYTKPLNRNRRDRNRVTVTIFLYRAVAFYFIGKSSL